MNPDIHPSVEPLAALIGVWRGRGAGRYPTIEPFEYVEEVTFGHVGKPFLAYAQKTRHAETDLPLHAETGYWRPVTDDAGGVTGLEVVLSHPTGIVEIYAGTVDGAVDGTVIEMQTRSIGLTPTAKSVTDVRRRFELDGDTLRYDVAMAAVGQPLTHHLSAELHRS
ncbi:MAG: FABP family protein [Acidimicrobiales bacterium]